MIWVYCTYSVDLLPVLCFSKRLPQVAWTPHSLTDALEQGSALWVSDLERGFSVVDRDGYGVGKLEEK